ncbi:hypothetical protein KM043_009892 [Ampulex compressa]|nr:hypothetical protein KM043_009892 [Ampulex compressa]
MMKALSLFNGSSVSLRGGRPRLRRLRPGLLHIRFLVPPSSLSRHLRSSPGADALCSVEEEIRQFTPRPNSPQRMARFEVGPCVRNLFAKTSVARRYLTPTRRNCLFPEVCG